MARIRTIKPEFWTDKRVSQWPLFTRLLYIGLWSAADDHGRGSAEVARVAAELFPYDLSRHSRETLASVSEGLARLSEEHRIVLYNVDGEVFYQVENWAKHQRVDKPGKSRIPTPCDKFATLSRDSRECLATLSRLEQGTGNREQGTGNLLFDRSSNDMNGGKGSVDDPVEPDEAETPESYTDEFSEFWSAYPRKTGKRNAFKAFKRAKRRAKARIIIDSAAEYALARDGCDPEFTMQAERWLNGDHWEDDRSSWRLPGSRQTRLDSQTDLMLSPELLDALESGVDFGF